LPDQNNYFATINTYTNFAYTVVNLHINIISVNEKSKIFYRKLGLKVWE